MKSRNSVIQLAIVAAFSGATLMSHAALITPATALQIATEIPTTGTALTGAANAFDIGASATAFTPSASQVLQVTVNLDSGAKFTANPTMNCNFVSAVGPNTSAAVVMTLNYGGANLSSAIFTVNSSAVTAAVGDTAILKNCTAGVAGVSVTGTHAAINATMSFQYGSIATSSKNGAYISYVKSVSAGVTPGTDAIAQVSGGFVGLTGAVTLLSAGAVYYTSNASGLGITGSQFDLSSGSLVSASLTVAGAALTSVTASNGVYLVSGAAACALASAITGGTVTAGSITFNGLLSSTVTAGVSVCLQFNGTSAIAAGPITATWTANPATGYTTDVSMASNTLVNITHNGTTLVAPLAQTPTGYLSRLVIVNAGPAAPYSVTSTSEAGNTATLTGAALSGTIAANTTAVIDLPTLVSYTAGKSPRTSLIVTVSGTNANVSGLYQIVDPTGSLSNYVMVKQ